MEGVLNLGEEYKSKTRVILNNNKTTKKEKEAGEIGVEKYVF